MCAPCRARGPIRNTIATPCRIRWRRTGSATSTWPRSAGCAARHDVAPDVNGFWENESFHNYADYAMSERFRAGLAHLRQLGETQRCAIMCAETVWWRCHRRIITDYLLAAGEQVFHILRRRKSNGQSSTRRLGGRAPASLSIRPLRPYSPDIFSG